VFSLAGKKALVVGIANEDSIAFGCASAFRAQDLISQFDLLTFGRHSLRQVLIRICSPTFAKAPRCAPGVHHGPPTAHQHRDLEEFRVLRALQLASIAS